MIDHLCRPTMVQHALYAPYINVDSGHNVQYKTRTFGLNNAVLEACEMASVLKQSQLEMNSSESFAKLRNVDSFYELPSEQECYQYYADYCRSSTDNPAWTVCDLEIWFTHYPLSHLASSAPFIIRLRSQPKLERC